MKQIITTSHGPSLFDKPVDPLSFYCTYQGVTIFSDRFSFLNRYSPFLLDTSHTLFGEITHTGSFSDICDRVGYDIISRAEQEDKRVYVSWSGGVDSTCVLVALLKHPRGKERLTVLYSTESIMEYSSFFDFLRVQGVSLQKINGDAIATLYPKLLDTDYIVFGWCGDQLFGSDLSLQYSSYFHRPWHDWLVDEGCPDRIIQQFEEGLPRHRFGIKNTGQFFWWMNFACKWNYVSNDIVTRIGIDKRSHVINFFEDEEFQQWAINRFPKVDRYRPDDVLHYKEEAKEYIYAYNKDSSYRKNKGKLGSWGRMGRTSTGVQKPVYTVVWRETFGSPIVTSAIGDEAIPTYAALRVAESYIPSLLAPYLKEGYNV